MKTVLVQHRRSTLASSSLGFLTKSSSLKWWLQTRAFGSSIGRFTHFSFSSHCKDMLINVGTNIHEKSYLFQQGRL